MAHLIIPLIAALVTSGLELSGSSDNEDCKLLIKGIKSEMSQNDFHRWVFLSCQGNPSLRTDYVAESIIIKRNK